MNDSAPGPSSGIVDLLGVLAYAELAAFLRLAEDAALLAPTLNDRAELGDVAAAEYGHFRVLRDRLSGLGVDPEEAMAPFVDSIDAWHAQTRPGDWYEALVKAYVGVGIAGDFYREAARHADPSIRSLVDEVLADESRSEFVVERVRAALEADPRLSGRLALWARRMVGEALSQGQRLAAVRPELAALLVATDNADGADGTGAIGAADGGIGDLAEVGRLFARLTEEHGRRMVALGLTPGS
ncbi:hydroxylase [Microbispora sp. RL4-1S]|uniref:Hydroxylase n=1 Tax=Microbispora oryzae TaxID=2806554 RepID=A0A941AKM6_9ACTN|nr:ferritin-like fold-containing protein [Microbispora oryzae]MBP2707635.1 hydroxylase [Microbispora oryzae]